MKKSAARKLEIFLLLALRQSARRRASDSAAPTSAETELETPPEVEVDFAEEIFQAFSEQLNQPDAEKFERLRVNYQNKSEAERQKWRARIDATMRGARDGDEDFLIDENVHRSRLEASLKSEIPAIRKIAARALPPAHRNLYAADGNEAEEDSPQKKSRIPARLEKTVRQTFAAQFVSLKDLRQAGAFDRLSGAQLARLVRFTGIREVAVACAGIKAVEAVAGFLRRFAPEDARAVAAQLSSLPKISDERLAFAENLVQRALEIEPQPSSAMLDWLGIRLVGILLCAPERESAARVIYAEQKLPLEAEPKLSAIVHIECRKTPDALKRKIASEIERLAATISDAGAKSA